MSGQRGVVRCGGTGIKENNHGVESRYGRTRGLMRTRMWAKPVAWDLINMGRDHQFLARALSGLSGDS